MISATLWLFRMVFLFLLIASYLLNISRCILWIQLFELVLYLYWLFVLLKEIRINKPCHTSCYRFDQCLSNETDRSTIKRLQKITCCFFCGSQLLLGWYPCSYYDFHICFTSKNSERLSLKNCIVVYIVLLIHYFVFNNKLCCTTECITL